MLGFARRLPLLDWSCLPVGGLPVSAFGGLQGRKNALLLLIFLLVLLPLLDTAAVPLLDLAATKSSTK
jgi:hypothetical protein